jgi:hypothetical protein
MNCVLTDASNTSGRNGHQTARFASHSNIGYKNYKNLQIKNLYLDEDPEKWTAINRSFSIRGKIFYTPNGAG